MQGNQFVAQIRYHSIPEVNQAQGGPTALIQPPQEMVGGQVGVDQVRRTTPVNQRLHRQQKILDLFDQIPGHCLLGLMERFTAGVLGL